MLSILTLVLFLLAAVTATFAWWDLSQKEKEVDIVIGDRVKIVIVDLSDPVLGELVPAGEKFYSNQVEEINLEYKVKVDLEKFVKNLKLIVTPQVDIVDGDGNAKDYIKVELTIPTDTFTAKTDELTVTVKITLDVPDADQTPETAELLKNTNWKIKLVFELVEV